MSAFKSFTRTNKNGDMLFKGLICAVIGAIILLAPYFARSPDIQEMMRQAYIVGWFALVLGVAFLVQFGIRWNKYRIGQAAIDSYKEQNDSKKANRKR